MRSEFVVPMQGELKFNSKGDVLKDEKIKLKFLAGILIMVMLIFISQKLK
jgi:hypothetical protein